MTATSKGAALRSAYLELSKADAASDWEKALRTCNRILKTNPYETKAFQCKIVCLIQMSNFDEALQTIKKTAPSVAQDISFEKAYCEYRQNKNDDALASLANAEDGDDARKLELLAQLYYRASRFTDCHRIYTRLMKEHTDGSDEERYTNLLAVEAQMANDGEKASHSSRQDADLETYEQCYNRSCVLIAGGQYSRAIELLMQAENKCSTDLQADGAGEDEIDDELSQMRAQRAYCMQMMKKSDDVGSIVDIYTKVLKSKSSDAIVNACVQNNLVATRSDLTVFEARKRLKSCHTAAVQAKLTQKQKRVFAINDALLLFGNNQYDAAKKSAETLRNTHNEYEYSTIIDACVAHKLKDYTKAMTVLQTYIKKHGHTEMISRVLAQVQLSAGDVSSALATLQTIKSMNDTPALLSLRVAHLLHEKKNDEAMKVLTDGVKTFANTPSHADIVEHCAALYERLDKHKEAAEYLETLRPTDTNIAARLIQNYVKFDTKKADALSRSLGETTSSTKGNNDMDTGQDLDTLESSDFLLLGERYRAKKEAKHATPGNVDKTAARNKRKRKRKSRLPANYDPNAKLDPERWLPKRERSTYKDKRKKDKRKEKDRDVGRGTQGTSAATAAITASLDASNRPTQMAPTIPGSPSHASPGLAGTGPRQNKPAGAASKQAKKKKGGNKGW